MIQRISAVILGAYFIFIAAYIVMHPDLDYQTWRGLFAHPAMRVASLLALLSLLAHAWIGLWTVATDYIKCFYLRMSFYVIVFVVLVGLFLWGLTLFWGL